MSAWWLFFLVYSFVIFSVEGDGNSNSASSTAEVPSQGTSCLARASQRPDSAEFCKTQESSWNTAVPSLQGLWLPLQDPSRDDELTGIWVALWLLQENALAERLVLRPVWSELGELCSPYGQAGWTESRPVEFLADCEHCFEDEEPKAAETVVKEEKQMERFGTAIKFACRAILAWKCNSMASDAADVLSNASWMGSQRAWKRNSTELSAASNACTSTIAAATAYDEWLSVTARRSMASSTHACYAVHAFPATTVRSRCNGGSGRAESGTQCTTKAQQDRQGGQERRQSVFGIPVSCARRDEERRQGEHQQFVGSGQSKWEGERSPLGSGIIKNATLVSVESFLATIRGQVERIHVSISSIGSCFPVQDARSHPAPATYAEESGHCQEASRCYEQGRGISLITEDEMEDSEAREEEEIPRDENAQKIQEGLNNVVSSLTELSDSADKLEPKPKRPRTRDDENPGDSKAGGRQPSLQPFRKADGA